MDITNNMVENGPLKIFGSILSKPVAEMLAISYLKALKT
jgi:hypothetical protein